MHRRPFLGRLAALAAAPLIGTTLRARRGTPNVGAPRSSAPDFSVIERGVAGRLGVAVLDTATGRRLAHRGDERFATCSTFKWLLAAQVLSRVDAGEEQLARIIPYAASDLLDYAPIARARLADGGMSVQDLCDAIVRYSDNTAANLLLASVGGPSALTAWLRRIGDGVTRLDRNEPELNTAVPGDARDTTSPAAQVANLERIVLGDVLRAESRERLTGWLVTNTTGNEKLRAGFPTAWRVGDKTGNCSYGSTNDLAIAWPPSRRPVLVAVYLTECEASLADRNGAIAQVAREVTRWIEERS